MVLLEQQKKNCFAEIELDFFNIYFSAVKISTLTQAINFSSLTALKIFNAVNTGAELVLATSLTTAASVSFFLTRITFI